MASNVTTALARLGGSRGFREVRSRDAEGPIELEIKYRMEPGRSLVTYRLVIDEVGRRPVVARELLMYRRFRYGRPWHFLDFRSGEGFAVTNEAEETTDASQLRRDQQSLKSPDLLAIKGLAQFERFPAVVALGELVENWHVSDFHISKARPEQEAGYAEHLSREGENLALVIEYLHDQHKLVFEKILDSFKRRVPGMSRVEAKQTEEGRILLRFKDEAFADPFLARHVSDGTIKMLAYLTLLYDPNPHPLLGVEERRISSIPACSKNWLRSSETTPIAADRCSCPRTPQTSSTRQRSTRCSCSVERMATRASYEPEMTNSSVRSWRTATRWATCGSRASSRLSIHSMNLAIFFEELSAREMLRGLLPRLLPPQIAVQYVVFEGKQDLGRNLMRRLRGWRKPNTAFVVLQDQDSNDCIALKQELVRKCEEAGKPSAVVRIVCRELESWYFGDLVAVEHGLGLSNLRDHAAKRKYRVPDSIHSPSSELKKITGDAYQKVRGSREIGPHLRPDSNTSHSFGVFVATVRHLASGVEP